ncbi:hypothetical protein IG631_11470 [Alternaria alternata]|nr:hypothetical protein IG631_11470 [Alternaria alternata]
MPPDIVRPVSSTTLGCLITMAYRLGMTWSDFRLDEGKMRAIGNGRSFSTSIVRGMGLVVEYSGDWSYTGSWTGADRVLSVAADKVNPQASGAEVSTTTLNFSQCAKKPCLLANLAYEHQMTCGIIPAGPFVCRWDLQLTNAQSPTDLELKQLFSTLEINEDAKVALEASLSHRDPARRLPGFTDVMGLWCDWIPLQNLPSNKIDNPFPFPLTTMGEIPESRHVWRSELRKQESSLSDTCKLVLQFYDSWELQNPQGFLNNYRLKRTSDPEIDFFKKAFDDTTAYLGGLMEVIKAGFTSSVYDQLISVHISINSRSVEQAEENIKNNAARRLDSPPNHMDPIFQERAYIYAENVPRFVEEMRRSEFHDPRKNISYEDLWWILMMRLHAWTMSVNWVDDRGGVKIPSEYYYSPARV